MEANDEEVRVDDDATDEEEYEGMGAWAELCVGFCTGLSNVPAEDDLRGKVGLRSFFITSSFSTGGGATSSLSFTLSSRCLRNGSSGVVKFCAEEAGSSGLVPQVRAFVSGGRSLFPPSWMVLDGDLKGGGLFFGLSISSSFAGVGGLGSLPGFPPQVGDLRKPLKGAEVPWNWFNRSLIDGETGPWVLVGKSGLGDKPGLGFLVSKEAFLVSVGEGRFSKDGFLGNVGEGLGDSRSFLSASWDDRLGKAAFSLASNDGFLCNGTGGGVFSPSLPSFSTSTLLRFDKFSEIRRTSSDFLATGGGAAALAASCLAVTSFLVASGTLPAAIPLLSLEILACKGSSLFSSVGSGAAFCSGGTGSFLLTPTLLGVDFAAAALEEAAALGARLFGPLALALVICVNAGPCPGCSLLVLREALPARGRGAGEAVPETAGLARDEPSLLLGDGGPRDKRPAKLGLRRLAMPAAKGRFGCG